MSRSEIRQHIEYKLRCRELRPEIADRMLSSLDAMEVDRPADYAQLLEAATFRPLPDRCYHTAPTAARSSILRDGLLANDPREGTWADIAAGLGPVGVYVAAIPDETGRWAHRTVQWDIWSVDTSGLAETDWSHDRFNAGLDAWILHQAVPVERVALWGSRSIAAAPDQRGSGQIRAIEKEGA